MQNRTSPASIDVVFILQKARSAGRRKAKYVGTEKAAKKAAEKIQAKLVSMSGTDGTPFDPG